MSKNLFCFESFLSNHLWNCKQEKVGLVIFGAFRNFIWNVTGCLKLVLLELSLGSDGFGSVQMKCLIYDTNVQYVYAADSMRVWVEPHILVYLLRFLRCFRCGCSDHNRSSYFGDQICVHKLCKTDCCEFGLWSRNYCAGYCSLACGYLAWYIVLYRCREIALLLSGWS